MKLSKYKECIRIMDNLEVHYTYHIDRKISIKKEFF